MNELSKDGVLISHQISSFNDFVQRRLQKTVNEISSIKIELPTGEELKIKLGRIRLESPQIRESDGSVRDLLPHESRLRNLTYASPLFLEMTPVFEGREHSTEWVEVGEIPIMVGSCLCPLSKMNSEERIQAGEDPNDFGGYFIINGTERVVILSEEIAANRLILQKKGEEVSARINSEAMGFVQRHIFYRNPDGIINAEFASLAKLPVPIVVLMKALGMESDKEVIETINVSEADMEDIFINIYDTQITSKEDAIEYIGKKMKIRQKEQREDRTYQVLDNYLLAHIGQKPENRMDKAKYLGKIMHKLILLHKGEMQADDIDHYANKRLKLVGDLLESLFRSIIMGRWGLVARLQYNYQKMMKRGRKLLKLQSVVVSDVLTKQLMRSMATGTWVGGQTGVSQRLERSNWVRTQEHLRSVVSPLSSTQEHFEARELHPTQWGRLCAVRTPEGQSIGLRNFLAIGAVVTIPATEAEKAKILNTLENSGVEKKSVGGNVEIYLDGHFVGTTNSPNTIVNTLVEQRRKNKLPKVMNLAYHKERNEIIINTGGGRVRRPLVIVENGKPVLTEDHAKRLEKLDMNWKDALDQSLIEYLDTEEEENTYVALSRDDVKKDHTHMEINPALILGVASSMLAFPEKDRGDRLNYGSRMIVQSVGVYSQNYLLRDDTTSNILVYPQLPLVASETIEAVGLTDHPAGQNLVIAVSPFYGYNIEDAVILNKSSLERGLGRTYAFRTFVTEARKYWGGQEDIIGAPEPGVRGYRSEKEYTQLGPDGIVAPETAVSQGDVLVGKVSPMRFLGQTQEIRIGINAQRENSLTVEKVEHGKVEKVIITTTKDGNRLIKVCVREQKVPEIGDKFASRHGQKGVVGLIVPEEDMPFTANGLTPDILINPHAIPSRMTVGQLLELLAGKAGALAGKRINGTAFQSDEGELRKLLASFGFMDDGKEIMYNGVTGEKIEADILIGLGYYQRLYHMVSHKLHARSRGPVALLTKQPTEGRSKEGGLRFGEMEKDCLIAHGAAITLKERFGSDKTALQICIDCGIAAINDKIKGKTYCPLCGGHNITEVEIAYAFKLLIDELNSMLIYPKLIVSESEE